MNIFKNWSTLFGLLVLILFATLPSPTTQSPLEEREPSSSEALVTDADVAEARQAQPSQTLSWPKLIETAYSFVANWFKLPPRSALVMSKTGDDSRVDTIDRDDVEVNDGKEARQNLDVQSVINNNLQNKHDSGVGGAQHHHDHGAVPANAANLFNPPVPPRPTGIFGFTFPYVNPISILLQPFRFLASTMFGGELATQHILFDD